MKKIIPLGLIIIIISFLFNSCSSSEQSYRVMKQVGEDIPPGTAVILCRLNGFEDKGNYYLLDAKVKQVIGYGAATENIDPDSNLKLQLKKELTGLKSLKNGDELELEIRQPMMSMGDEKNFVWTVSQLIK